MAEKALSRFAKDACDMRFMDVRTLNILGADCIVSRSGYTGEDGFEISIPSDRASDIAAAFLDSDDVQPIGLGARDSLRLEAGMCLYGSDLDTTTTPVEANLIWAIQPARRMGGARAGGFPGADVILDQLARGPARLRVGLQPEGRAPVRTGAQIFANDTGGDAIGTVTSGGFGPSVNKPVAMGYVASAHSAPGTKLFAEVRGNRLAMTVSPMPFITPHYKR